MNKLFFILILIIFPACSSIPNSSWHTPLKIRQNSTALKSGDILLKKKDYGFLEWFGHCGIFTSNFLIAEFPKLGTGMHLLTLSDWAVGNREIIVLRLKNSSDEFSYALIENILQASDKKYKLVFNKKDNSGYYCSQFIWEIYYKTALQLGLNIDIDSDKGFAVFPYDFYGSSFLEEVEF
jgi:uncharacterized protein YycO